MNLLWKAFKLHLQCVSKSSGFEPRPFFIAIKTTCIHCLSLRLFTCKDGRTSKSSISFIPILSKTALLQEFKNKHVTLKPNGHVPIATGIPPCIAHTTTLKKVLDVCIEIKDEGREFKHEFRNGLHTNVYTTADDKVQMDGEGCYSEMCM
jgi:hypothetical protein